ncbi:hypothetical protein [Streptomyces sp. NPDC007264]|uniref:hypothetical protein n=1 Tax=Streptomyces sp. NPDC007264 TaxID=3364777 RepID=UPI0036D7BA1C
MSSYDGRISAHRPDNPFPASAVARFSPVGGEAFSIETPAVTQALSYVDGYLASSDDEQRRGSGADKGNVIAIVGEYGTGKTHLTIELLRRIKSGEDETVHAFYLDAPADTFLALYRERFFGQLDRKDVRRCVAEYYADIVAEDLGQSPLTKDVAQLLADRRLHPHEIVQRFGLPESTFHQKLEERLRRLTEHEEFGTALGLFMRPEFEAAVWEWLAGHPADTVLQERGIRRTIDDDISALEAIGVFAFLYGRQRHRFVLIIDEFEKVLSRDSRSVRNQGAVLAFKKLLEVFGQSRSLLVLSGLPDFMEVLPDDAKQRISCLVRPTALSFEDTREYIRNSLGTDSEDVAPFSDDAIAYLVELAGGNARKVIRLCFHAYEASARARTDITRAMVREVAREQFEVSTPDDVRSEVSRILDANGWVFEQAKRLVEDPAVTADYWLPVGQDGAGCAIMITRSVLHEPEAERLADSARRIRREKTNVEAVLIVNGYLAEPLEDTVTHAFSRVMPYAPMRFPDDFTAAIGAFVHRLEDALNEDRLALVESKLDQLLRQTQSVRRAVDLVQRDSLSPTYVESAVEGGVRRVFAALGGRPAEGSVSQPLHPATAELFRRALQDAEVLGRTTQAEVKSAFLRGRESSSLFERETLLRRAAVAQSLAMVVEVFRDAVAAATAAPRRDTASHRLDLGEACENYDRMFDAASSIVDFRRPLDSESGRDDFAARLDMIRGLARSVWDAERDERAGHAF